MIKTKKQLKYYIEEDAKMAKWPVSYSLMVVLKDLLFPNYNRRYLVCLRKMEYYNNIGGVFAKIRYLWYSMRLSRLSSKTGIDIGINIAGAGLCLPHGKVVINLNAKIGEKCKILPDVTIGWLGRKDMPFAVPVIGNRVFIGTGARIIGNVSIADDVVIGANSVVTKSITEPGTTWVGNPARKVSDNNSNLFL